LLSVLIVIAQPSLQFPASTSQCNRRDRRV
jgi:hypothetical protein